MRQVVRIGTSHRGGGRARAEELPSSYVWALDGIVCDSLTAHDWMGRWPDLQVVGPAHERPYVIAARPDSPELLQQVNLAPESGVPAATSRSSRHAGSAVPEPPGARGGRGKCLAGALARAILRATEEPSGSARGGSARCPAFQPWKADPMQTMSRGRAPRVMRVGLLCVALVMVALSGMLVACGGGDDETLPPPTVIRAEDTPAVNAEPATITPTLTATPKRATRLHPPPSHCRGRSAAAAHADADAGRLPSP